MVEFETFLYSPVLKMVLIFLVTKVLQKVQLSNKFMFNSHMRCPRGWGGGGGGKYSGFQMIGMIETLGLQTKSQKNPWTKI